MTRRSLTTRLLGGLIVAQVLAILAAMIVFPLLAPFVSFDDIADITLRDRIVAALRPQADALVVADDARLAAYQAQRPGIAFAIYDLRRAAIVAGSDPELAKALLHIRPLFPDVNGNLVTREPGMTTSLLVTRSDTPLGPLVFATRGNRFRVEDVPSVMISFLPALLPAYGPVIVGALFLIPLVVRLVTRPLRRLADEARGLSLDGLQHRLTDAGVGPELREVVEAINAALSRIAAGIVRQRRYAANAAHELRTPLAILSGHVEDLAEGVGKTVLRADVARIEALVEQLVTVARLGQNHVALDETVDLQALVRSIVADRAPLAIRRNRQIAFETDSAMAVWMSGNAQALSSAIGNILDNAIRAEPEGGCVLVRLTSAREIDVIDHGRGIPGDRAELVFEPFWRDGSGASDASPASPAFGAGLGLPIAREIAAHHDGTLTLSPTPGGGATFRFRFPARAAANAGDQLPATLPP